MFVENPIKITILNYDDSIKRIFKPIYPQNDMDKNLFECSLDKVLYIDREDFKIQGVNKKYKRFAPNRVVRIKYGGLIKYISHEVDSNNNVVNINVEHYKEHTIEDKIWGTIPKKG